MLNALPLRLFYKTGAYGNNWETLNFPDAEPGLTFSVYNTDQAEGRVYVYCYNSWRYLVLEEA